MIKQLASKTVYENPWMKVREDQVEFPNGHQGVYGVVEKDDFAMIVPYDGEFLYLVGQYRYPTGQVSWEFPQGKHEGQSSEDAAALARAELREETGLTANTLVEISYLYQAPGYSNQAFHLFLATELTLGHQELDVTEADLQVKKVTIIEFEQMVINGEITDAPTISGYGILKIKKVI
jgi:ADP-ribose pyrophosphatase